MKGRIWLIAAVILALAALFFFFAVTGHTYFGLMLLFVAGLIVLYHFAGHKLRIAATVVVLAGLAVFTVIEIPIIGAAHTDADDGCEYLVVLGAGLNGSTPSLSLTNRLTAAQAWLEEHPDCVAVLSGGQGDGEDMTEASAMASWLEARGIDPSRLIQEDRATSTMENLEYSFAIIRSLGGELGPNVAVLTSEYHLCRAKMMAADLGVEVTGVAARTSMPTLMINYFIREAVGVTHYHFFGA